MIITVDPAELSAASETLRACAVEAADIGSQLWSCVGCAMPPDIRASVDQIVATADRVLDNSGSHFSLWATDLAGRAQIALTDTLTAGSMAGGPATALTVGAGVAIGMSVIGGNSFGDFSITNSAGLDSVLTGAGIIGGIAPTRITIIDPTTGLAAAPMMGAGVIGGGSGNNIHNTLAITADNLRRGQAARLDAFGGGGPITGAMVMDLIGATGSTPFINGIDNHSIKPIGAMSFTEWANSMEIDTNKDGIPNGAQNNFRRNEPRRRDDD